MTERERLGILSLLSLAQLMGLCLQYCVECQRLSVAPDFDGDVVADFVMVQQIGEAVAVAERFVADLGDDVAGAAHRRDRRSNPRRHLDVDAPLHRQAVGLGDLGRDQLPAHAQIRPLDLALGDQLRGDVADGLGREWRSPALRPRRCLWNYRARWRC